jgi:hypothetical protein
MGEGAMKSIYVSLTILTIGMLFAGCNQQQPEQVATTEPYASNTNVLTNEALTDEYEYWAKDNLDLQRVGNVLQRSNSPEEFERYLNEDDGINNLDLNGDGYVDYISVDEYPYSDGYERGLSLYTRFGPDEVQELGTVVFYRDDINMPGARILITGNDQIYGDNYYYEANWLDKGLAIASLLFSPHDVYYRSPYYYDYYPPGYVAYEVVDPPIYRTRIEQLWPAPALVYTTAPAVINKIKIKSPNNGLHLGQIKARLVKPTKEQAEFIRNNPAKVRIAKADKSKRVDSPPGQAKQPKEDRKVEVDRGNPVKPANPGNPGKPENAEKPIMKQKDPGQGGNPGGKPQKEQKGKGKP